MRKKNDSEKNTTAAVIDGDVVVLSVEEQKCEHVANNDVEWVIDSATPHHIISTKGLFTTYKQGTLVQRRWVILVTQKL